MKSKKELLKLSEEQVPKKAFKAMGKLAQIELLKGDLKVLQPEAVKELRSLGYTLDQIKTLLKMGKVTVQKILDGEK